MQADTPIALANITKLTQDERDAMLFLIRERRLKAVKVYEALTLQQSEARREVLDSQWSKALEMFKKGLAATDKAILNLEARSTKLRAIELELEGI